MSKRLRALGFAAALLAFLLVCHIAAPVLYAADDTSLMRGYIQRRRLDGRLTAEALDIFLVRRLHERAQQPYYSGYWRSDAENEREFDEGLLRDRVEQCRPALGDATAELLLEALASENATFTFAHDNYYFWQGLCDFGDGQGMMGVEYDVLSDKVVRFWVQSNLYQSAGVAAGKLAVYREILGLDELADWQQGTGYYDATLTSGDAAIMLYLYDKDGVLQMGAEVLGERGEDPESPAQDAA